jgi:uncharacterized protein YecT (DUF1311 family)
VRTALLALVAIAGLVARIPPSAAQDVVRPEDRNAVAACIKAAAAAKKPSDTCIGTVQDSCMKAPGGETTVGMNDCAGRETAIWDERLNAAYKAALAGDLGRLAIAAEKGRSMTGADLLRRAQRAWISFRDTKCEAASLPMYGGTGAGLLAGSCYLQETARQAIWLETLPQP